MFQILVTSFNEAENFIEEKWPTRIISLIDNERVVNLLGPHHLHLKFNDVSSTNMVNPPLPEHLVQVLEFTKDLTDSDKVLVHCLAGISRSTAMAIAILIQHGMNYRDAYFHIAAVRPQLMPNHLITFYTDDYFNLNGELIALVKERYMRLMLPSSI